MDTEKMYLPIYSVGCILFKTGCIVTFLSYFGDNDIFFFRKSGSGLANEKKRTPSPTLNHLRFEWG